MKIKSAIISSILLFLLPAVSFAYEADTLTKNLVSSGYEISLKKSFPVEQITIKDVSGYAKQVNISGARDIASNGTELAVTGESGTHLLDMKGNIILDILQKGKLVALDRYIAVADNTSMTIFNRNGIMVCQRALPGFIIKNISIKGNLCKATVSYGTGVIAERSFTITEEALVEINGVMPPR